MAFILLIIGLFMGWHPLILFVLLLATVAAAVERSL